MNEKGKGTLDSGQSEQIPEGVKAPGEWSSLGGGACKEDGCHVVGTTEG